MIKPFDYCWRCRYAMNFPCPQLTDKYTQGLNFCPHFGVYQDSVRAEESYYIEPNE